MFRCWTSPDSLVRVTSGLMVSCAGRCSPAETCPMGGLRTQRWWRGCREDRFWVSLGLVLIRCMRWEEMVNMSSLLITLVLQVMRLCWATMPEDRPGFRGIKEKLTKVAQDIQGDWKKMPIEKISKLWNRNTVLIMWWNLIVLDSVTKLNSIYIFLETNMPEIMYFIGVCYQCLVNQNTSRSTTESMTPDLIYLCILCCSRNTLSENK